MIIQEKYTQVFDAGENRQIIIEVSGNVFDLSENIQPETFLKQDKILLEISDIKVCVCVYLK